MHQVTYLEAESIRGGFPAHLSSVEVAILRGLANGHQSKEIAADIDRKLPTVEFYIRNLFLKFDARSRAHLVALALCSGVLQPAEVGRQSAPCASPLPIRAIR